MPDVDLEECARAWAKTRAYVKAGKPEQAQHWFRVLADMLGMGEMLARGSAQRRTVVDINSEAGLWLRAMCANTHTRTLAFDIRDEGVACKQNDYEWTPALSVTE